MKSDVIEAAGGIVWRRKDGLDLVAVIHRARYDDWTLPKGKRESDESWTETARREILEETGCKVQFGAFAGCVSYIVKDVPKVVLYWHMEVVGDCAFEASEEVDRLEWYPVPKALETLDYEGERMLLESHRGQRTDPSSI